MDEDFCGNLYKALQHGATFINATSLSRKEPHVDISGLTGIWDEPLRWKCVFLSDGPVFQISFFRRNGSSVLQTKRERASGPVAAGP